VSVELRSVTKTYGPIRALAGVSVRFDPSRVSVVSGPNGSGKSTLLALIGTLARVTSGSIDHGGLGRSRREVRATLGWLGHDSLCYPDLTGRENIELAAKLHGRDPSTAFTQAVERFDVGAYAERPVRTYSRGQRQRVALARALVHSPKLLLLDEPTAGLDRASSERLRDVVRAEAARGAIVVVVTHDAGFAEEIADARVELERGRVVSG
jgi:ABC-type multidrug transport system ATPase subunit